MLMSGPASSSAAHREQHDPGHDGSDAYPDRHVERVFFLERKLDRSELHVMRCFRIAETAVDETEDTGHDKQYAHEFACAHQNRPFLNPDARLNHSAGSRRISR